MGRPDAYALAIDNIAQLAQAEVDAMLDTLDLDRPAECKRALMAAFPAIVARYGGMAALAAAELYGLERSGAVGDGYRPLLADAVEDGAMQAKLRYMLRHLFGEVEDGGRGV